MSRSFIMMQLYELACAAWRRRVLLIVPILVMPVIGVVLGLTTPKLYRSTMTLEFWDLNKMDPTLGDLRATTDPSERIGALRARLYSSGLLATVVSVNKLGDAEATAELEEHTKAHNEKVNKALEDLKSRRQVDLEAALAEMEEAEVVEADIEAFEVRYKADTDKSVAELIEEQNQIYQDNTRNLRKKRNIALGRALADLRISLNMDLVDKNVIEISYRSGNRETAAGILNTVGMLFIKSFVDPGRDNVTESLVFLDEELAKRETALRTSEQALADFKGLEAGRLPTLFTGAVERLDKLRLLLAERRSDLKGAQAAFSHSQERLLQTNPILGKIEARLIQAMEHLTELRARYTDQHSAVQAQMRIIESLQLEQRRLIQEGNTAAEMPSLDKWMQMGVNAEIGEEGVVKPFLISQLRVLQEAETRKARLEEEVRNLERETVIIEDKINSFGAVERQLSTLERDVEVKRNFYEELLKRRESAQVAENLTAFFENKEQGRQFGGANINQPITVIDLPNRPDKPITPSMLLFIFAAIFAGGALGVGLAFMAEILDTTVRSTFRLADLTGSRVITRIPKLPNECFNEDGAGLDPDLFLNLQTVRGMS
ncbi:MAG: hypothetical protein U9N14_07665 [Pseudomonadota bacterium]|nr:hypothetical protein [Pseudomonadota bacterium]